LIDLIAVAGLLGYSAAKDLTSEIARRRRSWSEKRLADHMVKVKTFAYDAAICRVLIEYYSRSRKITDLERYRAVVAGNNKETTIFTAPERTALRTPPSQADFKLEVADGPAVPAAVRNLAPTVIARLGKLEVRVTDDPIFRLMSAPLSGPNLSFRFARSSFYEYRFTAGLLEDELNDSLASHDGNIHAILKDPANTLPIREAILPEISSLTQYSGRICGGGLGVVFAMARGKPHNDFIIPIQTRSAKVADGQGRLSVLPKAWHQHIADPHEEVGIQSTIYRELFEEVYGGAGTEECGRRLSHDWYFEFPPLKYFRDHEGAFKNEIVAFGLNAVNGNYEFAILLAVIDTWYWSTFKPQMKPMWEFAQIEPVSTKDPHRIADLLLKGNWAPESVFSLVEGLIRLHKIEPERVDLPDLRRELVSDDAS
jgi:hypothetical protein